MSDISRAFHLLATLRKEAFKLHICSKQDLTGEEQQDGETSTSFLFLINLNAISNINEGKSNTDQKADKKS